MWRIAARLRRSLRHNRPGVGINSVHAVLGGPSRLLSAEAERFEVLFATLSETDAVLATRSILPVRTRRRQPWLWFPSVKLFAGSRRSSLL